MLFNTVQFFLFLAVVLALFYAAPPAWRKYILLAASYYFYASWNPKFLALLLTLTAIDYSAGIALEAVRPSRKKLVLILSLSASSSTTTSRPRIWLSYSRGRRAPSGSISFCRSASASTLSKACRTWSTCTAPGRGGLLRPPIPAVCL